MTYAIIASLLVASLCVLEFFRDYKTSRYQKNIFRRYHYLFRASEWVMISLMHTANFLAFILLLVIILVIHFVTSRANLGGSTW